jgi:hypothetical protein
MDPERADYADSDQPPPSRRWVHPLAALVVLVAILAGLSFLLSSRFFP